jgi:hypothetical protein
MFPGYLLNIHYSIKTAEILYNALKFDSYPAGQVIQITAVKLMTIFYVQEQRNRQRADVGSG